MRVAILGYGVQGKSAYDYWNTSENEVTVCDGNPDTKVPDGTSSQLGPAYLEGLDGFDLLVRSPIVHPRDIAAAYPDNPGIFDKVTTNTNEFFRVCPSKNIIAVTGTKGKGTTSTLIAKILEAAGKRVHLGGNIGTPPLELLKNDIQTNDWVVLELANFQLIDLKHSPHIAVCLLVEPEHLDWHTDMAEYINAKQQLFAHQTANDFAIYYAENENSRRVAEASPGSLVPYMRSPGAEVVDGNIVIGGQKICDTDELKLLGKHNWQNVCAAVTAVWQVCQDVSAMREVLTNFAGLPFRIEFRREVSGVRYYNDSFASAPSATIAAIDAVPEAKVVIMGGFERNLDLSELAGYLAENAGSIRKAVLIGASADRLAAELDKAGFSDYEHCRSKSMQEIVETAARSAQSGDAVVLSPAFASFDMFKNFEDRGNQFNEAVEKL